MTIAKGAIAKTKTIVSVRPLTKDDLEKLKEPRAGQQMLSKLRDPHHNLARKLAWGMFPVQAAQACGYSIARVVQLQNDPTFKELVEQYRKQMVGKEAEEADDFHDLLFGNMMKAERQIAEHLDRADEEGELLPIRNLQAISRDAADRTGYGKRQMNLNVNVDFAAKLEGAIKRSGKVLDGRAVRSVTAEAVQSGDQVATLPDRPRIRRRA